MSRPWPPAASRRQRPDDAVAAQNLQPGSAAVPTRRPPSARIGRGQRRRDRRSEATPRPYNRERSDRLRAAPTDASRGVPWIRDTWLRHAALQPMRRVPRLRRVPQPAGLHPRRPPARARSRRSRMPDRVRGAALFADISGFTPLTEALADELGPQRGAEELTAHLNRVFHALIDELDRYGGARHLLQRRRDHLLDRRRRRPARDRLRPRDAGDDGSRWAKSSTPAGSRVPLAHEGRGRRRRGAPVRRRRPRDPADRRARRPA